MPDRISELSQRLKQEAIRIGFSGCGISAADRLDEEERRLTDWLSKGYHGTMGWMSNHFEKRVDPRELVPGARSVISVLQNYYHPYELSENPAVGRISRYALGDDYHKVMKGRLHKLYDWLKNEYPDLDGRVFVDSAPVMDKAWAAKAGLGWIGKHSNLINTEIGSWFFIGEMIVNVDLNPDSPVPDMCGSCTKCLDACPTGAIVESYVVDANRCISYLTIENRTDHMPSDVAGQMGNWIFGCDICQDVCPWNKFRTDSKEDAYAPRHENLDRPLRAWEEINQETFSRAFRNSPVKRTKVSGFARNVRNALENMNSGSRPLSKTDSDQK